MPYKLSFPLMGIVAMVLMYGVLLYTQTPTAQKLWTVLAAMAVVNLLCCFGIGYFVDNQLKPKPPQKGDKPCCKCQQ